MWRLFPIMPEALRKAKVLYKDLLAGYLYEVEGGFEFVYDKDYLGSGPPISISLPLRAAPYFSKTLFSFFKGLAPEGWYLHIVSSTAKVDKNDDFGILLTTSSADTIGAVTIHRIEEKPEQ